MNESPHFLSLSSGINAEKCSEDNRKVSRDEKK